MKKTQCWQSQKSINVLSCLIILWLLSQTKFFFWIRNKRKLEKRRKTKENLRGLNHNLRIILRKKRRSRDKKWVAFLGFDPLLRPKKNGKNSVRIILFPQNMKKESKNELCIRETGFSEFFIFFFFFIIIGRRHEGKKKRAAKSV